MDTIIAIILVIIIVGIEVAGIWYVNKINSKPDEDFKDWDVTIADGLDELEEQEKQPWVSFQKDGWVGQFPHTTFQKPIL